MVPPSDTQPAWLFSFVDLAFLLLIAMTQIAGDVGGLVPDLGEVLVPRIGAGATTALPAGAPDRWQVRIHPASGAQEPPFEMHAPDAGAASADAAPERLDAAGLRGALEALHAAGAPRPILAPHADSRSQDLLDAVAVVESLWPGRRRATVSPVFGTP